MDKKEDRKKYFPTIIIILISLLVMLLGCASEQADYHAHADFKVYLDNVQFDFNKEEYMSTPIKHLSEKTHLHDFNPNVIHFHEKGVTLKDFFESIGIQVTNECFGTLKNSYCTNEQKQLLVYVNAKIEKSMFNYAPKDLDKILVFYGSGGPSNEMFSSITRQACIYSLKCQPPEGFVLPQESCSADQPCEIDLETLKEQAEQAD